MSVHKSELQSSEYTLVGEHLSHLDPTDEFLSEDGRSVIEAAGRMGSVSSYSFVEDADIDASVLSGQQVRTHRDLQAEDEMMQRFVNYISLVSEDVLKILEQHRSKEARLQGVEGEARQVFLLDVDSLDMGLIELILNTLENFELFAFCLVICNRY